MANLNSVTTNYFPVSSETYTNNINATLGAGATVVPVNSASAYNDGDVVVLTVDPGTASQATFTGVKASTPDRFINCFWTEGNTGVGHSNGAVITDYDSATHYDLVTKGVRSFANQDGTLKTTAVQQAIGISNTPSVGWNVMSQSLTYTGNSGNNVYTANFTGDVTPILSPGMKILAPRMATAPSQAMSFSAASTQFASRTASLTGFGSLATVVTISSWIYLNSYNASNYQTIATFGSTTHATNGFKLSIVSGAGQLELGMYTSASNSRNLTSQQVIPLKKWVHIAATLNISTGVGSLWINGSPVVSSVTTVGSPTTMTTATAYYIGRSLFGEYFDGYIADQEVWSTTLTTAQVQANMNIALTGSETNLIANWQGNGNFNDKTANANNLTASGGAVATTTLASIGSTYAAANEYFYVLSVGAFSGGLTPVSLFGGTDGHLPNAAIGTIQYSNTKQPYGFPADNRYVIEVYDDTLADKLVSIGILAPVDRIKFGSNTGTAGGQYTISRTGSRKELWAATNTVNSTTSPTTYTIVLPTGFFNNVDEANITSFSNGGTAYHVSNIDGIPTTTSITFYLWAITGAGSARLFIRAIGS